MRMNREDLICAGMLTVLLLACAGATWVVDDDGGAGYVDTQVAEAAA